MKKKPKKAWGGMVFYKDCNPKHKRVKFTHTFNFYPTILVTWQQCLAVIAS